MRRIKKVNEIIKRVLYVFIVGSFLILQAQTPAPKIEQSFNLLSNPTALVGLVVTLVFAIALVIYAIKFLPGKPSKEKEKITVKKDLKSPSLKLSDKKIVVKPGIVKKEPVIPSVNKKPPVLDRLKRPTIEEIQTPPVKIPEPPPVKKEEPKPIETPKKAPLFDEEKLESALDSLFAEPVKKEETKPIEPSKKAPLFDEEKLESALDSLFAEPVKKEETKRVEEKKKIIAPKLSETAAVSSEPKKQISQKPKQDGLISIGKLLVDENTLQEIIKTAEKGGGGLTTTQVISAVKGQSLDSLLGDINKVPGVEGSLIVGKDGLVITNTMPSEIDKDLVGALSSSLFANIDIQVKRMERGSLKRVIMETENGIIVLSEVEMGTIVVFSKITKDFNLNRLMAAVISVTGKK